MPMHGGVARDGWNPLGIRRNKLLKDGTDATALVKSFYEMQDDEVAISIGMEQHEFTLEVRVSGREPYDVQGLFKIPPKRIADMGAGGAIVPVKVHPSEPDRVAIDWDSWDGKRDESFQPSERPEEGSFETTIVGAAMASIPDSTKSMMLNGWIDARRAGGLSQKDFEQALADAVASGMITQADADTAKQQFS